MNRKQNQRAVKLADQLLNGLGEIEAGGNAAREAAIADLIKTAARLREFLKPPPSMEQILQMVPGDTVKDRAKEIGVSRQHYYNLLWNTSRPSLLVARRLADLTGIEIETIKGIW